MTTRTMSGSGARVLALAAGVLLAFTACGEGDPDSDPAGAAPAAATTTEAAAIEVAPLNLCPDLRFTPEIRRACIGGGFQTCHKNCVIDRHLVFTPSGAECRTGDSTCSPWICGPCSNPPFGAPDELDPIPGL